MQIIPKGQLKGEVVIPGDKSISHRGIMFGALSRGDTHITHFLDSADCLSTIQCFSKMGIDIERSGNEVTVHGKGLHALTAPSGILDAGNSGTTTRLMSGILAGQDFECVIDGDASLRKRPMKRIMDPLTMMGADIESTAGNGCLPLRIKGAALKGIHYNSPVASAQVKSCVLLAGLYADGETFVTEPFLSRDHTERMLRAFGVDVISEGVTSSVTPPDELHAISLAVPGDISSAAYWIGAGCVIPGSEILLKDVGINPTRDGILKAAAAMGADITVLNASEEGAEPVADLLIRHSTLKGTVIEGAMIPTLIDELPLVAVMAAFAEGTTVIKDAKELRVKESDRITLMTENLRAMGADITPQEDGWIINGGKSLHSADIRTAADHRIAMSMVIAALGAGCPVTLDDAACIGISYPSFLSDLEKAGALKFE